MLLLVIDAELDQRRRVKRGLAGSEQERKRLVHMGAILAHGRGRGAREQPAPAPGLPWADAVVVGVETVFEAVVENAVAAQEALQHEGFEEPGGMGEMPLGG